MPDTTTEVTTDSPMTEVVRGILTDFQQLMTQQIALLKAEIKKDWGVTKTALLPLVAGAMFCGISLLQFSIALSLGIYAAASSVPDAARIPLWGCFAIGGLVFLVVGGSLVAVGVYTMRSFNPLPEETVRAFEKNLQTFVATSSSVPAHSAPR